MHGTYQEKHTVILPCKHDITQLIVTDAHSRVLHGNVSGTMMQVRQRFWVMQARQEAKKLSTPAFCAKDSVQNQHQLSMRLYPSAHVDLKTRKCAQVKHKMARTSAIL